MATRPRIVAPIYGSADHVRSVSSLPTSPGRPVSRIRVPTIGSTYSEQTTGPDGEVIVPITDAAAPNQLPTASASDPGLLSDQGQRKDIAFDDQVDRMAWEVERERAQHRIVEGLDTLDFYALLRSFDKQVQHVRLATPADYIPAGLDLHPDPEEELSIVKARNSLERLYTTVGMGMLRVFREVQRIRNWEDGARSMIALSIYTYAWWCNLIIATFLSFLSILVLVPSSRRWFFETAAHRISDNKDGKDAQKIVSERTDNIWGPAAVESSATRWAEGVQDAVSSLAAGQKPSQEKSVRDGAKQAFDDKLKEDLEEQDTADQKDPKDDKRNRRELAIRLYGQPAMRVIAGIADKWERFEKYVNHPVGRADSSVLEPKSHVFRSHRRYAVFLQLLLPGILTTIFVSERAISRGLGFIFGFLLFAQPLISYTMKELDRNIPDWKSKLIIEFNLFETSPTNAQLVLGVLRDAEHRRDPLPPAPHPDDDLDSAPVKEIGYAHHEHVDDSDDDDDDDDDDSAKDKREQIVGKISSAGAKGKDTTRAKARKAWDKLGRAKEEGFAVVAGHKKIDIQAKAELMLDKLHISKDHKLVTKALDRMPSRPIEIKGETPSSFYVWHKKHGPGHVVIHPADVQGQVPARVEFSTIRKKKTIENTTIDPANDPATGHLVVPIDDIVALKKVGMSTVKRTALNWALDSEGAGGTGLEVKVIRRPTDLEQMEETLELTSIVRRDELFNRLIALGSQRWQML